MIVGKPAGTIFSKAHTGLPDLLFIINFGKVEPIFYEILEIIFLLLLSIKRKHTFDLLQIKPGI